MNLKWNIRGASGRYLNMHNPITADFSMITQKQYATVFENTRDYMDGYCKALSMFGENMEPVPTIHIQQPANEQT